ncbi:hypothetical protein BDV98DRAFT_602739 [Pterulicium gracile]|uniref:Uncharacterized protein n=1 Tax=Pterulicium gracile TaxID=1884261 RepID=A0A5C3QNS4_9AGAR|nr:hypothetical protein BDV98DRAFT_602739 [Pterula gracilis]
MDHGQPTSSSASNLVIPTSADDVTRLSKVSESLHWDVKSFIVEMSVYGAYFILCVLALRALLLVLSSTITPTTPLDHPLSQTYRVFTSLTLIMTAMYTPALILIINYGYCIADSVQIDTCTAVSVPGQERKSPRRVTEQYFL